MKQVVIADVTLDACTVCDGVWFDRSEMKRVIEMPEATLEKSDLSASLKGDTARPERPGNSPLSCPRCGENLWSYRYGATSEIIIEGCKKGCGVWTDGGELKKIRDYLEESRKPPTAEKMREIQKRMKKADKEAGRLKDPVILNMLRESEDTFSGRMTNEIIRFLNDIFYGKRV